MIRPPSEHTSAIIFISSSTTMKSSSVSLVSAMNSRKAGSRSASSAGCRKVPEIGFIHTRPSATLTCRSGVAPTRLWPGVCTAKVQYAPRSSSSRVRNQVSTASAGSVSVWATTSRRITKLAPSPSPISSVITRATVAA